MIIFNTTFSIHESITNQCLKYIQTQYIPNMIDDGFIKPLLLKIHSESTDGYHNYAVQFYASTLDFVYNWKKEMEKEYIKYLDNYEIGLALNTLEKFFWNFCDNYIEITKHRLYRPEEFGIKERYSGQKTIYIIL